MMGELMNPSDADLLAEKIESLIEESRRRVVAQVNSVMVRTYFEIGRVIVENEQEGKSRAAYGKGVLKELSRRLTERFGKGFSVENLDRMRYFYRVYSKNSSTLLTNSTEFTLSWSHYLFLMRIDNPDERSFYER